MTEQRAVVGIIWVDLCTGKLQAGIQTTKYGKENDDVMVYNGRLTEDGNRLTFQRVKEE